VGGPVNTPVKRPSPPLRAAVVVVGLVLLLILTGPPAQPASVPGTSSAGASPSAAALPGPSEGPVTVAAAYTPPNGVTEVGPVPASTPFDVLVGLASRDPSGLQAEVAAEYAPGSDLYHHYLTPAEVEARYGPSPSSGAAATQYFARFGLAAETLPGGSLLSVTGPASAVESAFGTALDDYRTRTGHLFVSHPTAATLPAGIPWTGALGLGNTTAPVPLVAPATAPVGRATAGPQASCSGALYGLSPCQVWGGYDSRGLITNGTNGSGERIAVVDVYDASEPQSRLASDLASFDSTFSLPAPAVSYNYPVNTSVNLNSTSTGWGLEEALDLEWSHASAPGASIAVTFAPNTNLGLYEAVNWLVATHRVDVVSLSWGEPDVGVFNAYNGECVQACNASTDGSYELLSPVLAAAALEGITVLAASGDCGSAGGTSGVSTSYPSSDPFVTGVGGTILTVTSSGTWTNEIAWSGNSSGAVSPGCDNEGGSGGGYAPFPLPWWQNGTGVPSAELNRGDPDVSADAAAAVEIVAGGGPTSVAGTSLSTPLWAGFTAIADQFAGAALGYLNPELYAILRGPNYPSDFHNITSGSNGAYFAAKGWNPVTGIGTPILGHLVHDLTESRPPSSSLRVGLVATPTDGAAPLSVSFFALPTGGTRSYSLQDISFGDGNSALAPTGSAGHQYTSDGVYPAVAYVVDSSGNTSASPPVAVVVGGSSLAVTLSVSDPAPAAGAGIQFNATVTGGTSPYLYTFSFGDGTYLNGSASNTTTHAFPVAGGFCADVIVTDAATPTDGGTSGIVPVAVGGATAPKCSNVTKPFTVVADAHPGVRDAPADYPALFTLSGGNATGPPSEVLASNDPYVGACGCTIFRSAGTYSVTLNATDSNGDRAHNETNVTVAPALVGSFSTSTPYGPAPLTVLFSATVTGGYRANASRTMWDFGDGTSLGGAAVSHTYTAPGLYFATGDAEDSGHGNASEGFVIDVLPTNGSAAPAVTGTVDPAVHVVAGATVDFTAGSSFSTTPVLFNWSLGDGVSALLANASTTVYAPLSGYSPAREFWLNVTWPLLHQSVSVPILDDAFLEAQAGGSLPRTDDLVASPYSTPGHGTAPATWIGWVNANGPGTVAYAWSLGDGNHSTNSSVVETYGIPRYYTATVNVTDSWGDSAHFPFGVAVHSSVPISIRATVTPLRGGAPLIVSLSASASGGAGGPFGYLWSLGRGVTSTNASTSLTYAVEGTYNVSLAVTDSQGTTALENWTITVSAASPGGAGGGEPLALIAGVAAVIVAVPVVAWVALRRRRRAPPPEPPTP
jgi:kumamolisin